MILSKDKSLQIILNYSFFFFTTLDTKLTTVINYNTGCLMFKTLHCAFTYLKKSCTCNFTVK